jgi:hypothetical protein
VGRLDGAESLDVEGGGVDVDAPDFAVPDFDGVDQPHGVRDELGVVARVFAEDHDQPLVPAVLHRGHLRADFVRAERAPYRVGVRATEGAILAIVAAQVADVQRSEEHDAVAVDIALELPGGGKDFFRQIRIISLEQRGGFSQAQSLLGEALGNYFAHTGRLRLHAGQ